MFGSCTAGGDRLDRAGRKVVQGIRMAFRKGGNRQRITVSGEKLPDMDLDKSDGRRNSTRKQRNILNPICSR